MADDDMTLRNTVLFDKPYLWVGRKGEPLRLLGLAEATKFARTEFGVETEVDS